MPLRILHLEDDPNDAELIGAALRAGGIACEVAQVETQEQLITALEGSDFDLILSDFSLPGFDGRSALSISAEKSPGVPFIFVSGTIGEETAVETLKSGATDYVIKQKLSRLVPAVRRALREAEERRERKKAEDALKERMHLAEFAAVVGKALTEEEELREMLQKCAQAMVRHLDAAFARIWTLNPTENVLELQASAGTYTHIDGGHSRIPVGQYKIGLIASEQKPHLANKVVGDPRVHDQEWAKREGMVAFAGYPLVVNNRLVGVMAMFARKPLSEATVQAMGLVAGQIAVGTERKRAEERAQQNYERIRALHEIDLAITSTLDLPSILYVLLENIDRFFSHPAASKVRLLNKLTGSLEPVACRGIPLEEWRAFMSTVEQDYAREIIDKRKHLIIANVQTDPRTRHITLFRKHGLVSWLGVPLVAKDEVLGVLSYATKGFHQFANEEVEFLETLAGQAAIALHNAQLYEQTKRQSVELLSANRQIEEREQIQRLLKELSQDVTTMELQSLLKKLTLKVREVFRVDVCEVRTVEGDSWRELANSGLPEERDPPRGRGRRSGLSSWIRTNRKALAIRDVREAKEFPVGRRIQRLGLRGFLGVPLTTKEGEVTGVLECMTYESRVFTPEECDLLQQLANGGAIAIENTWLYQDLDKSNKVKTEFLGVMSHELRTPLNVIMGYTGILRDGVLGELNARQQDGLSKIARQSSELLHMITSVMEAAKIESGASVVEREPVNVVGLFDQFKLTYDIPQDKELTLAWNYPPDLPTVMTDAAKLKMILQNLINNAIKFTETGSIAISARVVHGNDIDPISSLTSFNGEGHEFKDVRDTNHGIRATDDDRRETAYRRRQTDHESPAAIHEPRIANHEPPNMSDAGRNRNHVEFTVSDTGIGIAKENLARVFEMFRQIDSSDTRLYGGVGLGLFIVKQVTELLGGTVEVESEVGKGSTFVVKLPL